MQEASDYLGGDRSTSLIIIEVLTVFSNFFFVWFLGMCTACYGAPRARGYVLRRSPCRDVIVRGTVVA